MEGREAAFESWLDDNGVVRQCKLGPVPTGRGAVATSDIAWGSVVVEVPDDATLHAENCTASRVLSRHGFVAGGAGDADADPEASWRAEVGLVLAVMVERARGRVSRWCAYLDVLPTNPQLPHTWPASDLASLDGTSVADKLLGYGAAVPGVSPSDLPAGADELYRTVVKPFGKKLGLKALGGRKLRALYRWSLAVVCAYSFSLGDDRIPALVPLWDGLNHVTGQSTVRLHHDESRGVLQMLATRAQSAGQELINSYGDKSSAELLLSYGYVEPLDVANPHEAAEMSLMDLLQVTGWGGTAHLAGRASQKRARACDDNDGHSHGHVCTVSCGDHRGPQASRLAWIAQRCCRGGDAWFRIPVGGGSPPPGLLEAVRLLLLPAPEFDAFQRRVARWRPPLTRPLHPVTDIDVPHGLAAAVRRAVAARLGRLAEAGCDPRAATGASVPRLVAACAVRTHETSALAGLASWLAPRTDAALVALAAKVWAHVTFAADGDETALL